MIISRLIKRYLFVIVIKFECFNRTMPSVMTLVTRYNHKLSFSVAGERGKNDDGGGGGSVLVDDDVFVCIVTKSMCVQMLFCVVL